jgi:hypothetical protein
MASRSAQPELDLNHQISHLLHTAVTQAQRQQAHLLSEACRAWLQTTSTEAQKAKFAALLRQQPDDASRFKAVDHILDKLFIPAFKSTKAHGQILQRVEVILSASQLIAPSNQLVKPGQEDAPECPAAESPDSAWSGLLLVDAENINMPAALEDLLQTIGRYPIRYRLAFGNWRKLGNRDRSFYRRGYQMIHVPPGKNSADIKMSLDASLILLRDPSVREVFICSADSDLLHLAHALLGQGVTPYRVSHNRNGFTILNLASRTKQTFSLLQGSLESRKTLIATDPDADLFDTSPGYNMPSLEEMKQWLLDLIWQEQEANPEAPLTVNELGKHFRDCHQISANQALQANSGYKNLSQFLVAQDELELHPLPGGKQIAVTLKSTDQALEADPLEVEDLEAEEPENSMAQNHAADESDIATHTAADTHSLELVQTPVVANVQGETTDSPGLEMNYPNVATHAITDAYSLEQALVGLLWNLSSHQSGGQISLSMLSVYFAHVYNEPMSKVLKRIGEPKSLPKFLAKCRSLRIQRQDSDWQVALTCVS